MVQFQHSTRDELKFEKKIHSENNQENIGQCEKWMEKSSLQVT